MEYYSVSKRKGKGNSLAVQWLGLRAFTVKGPGSIPGEGTEIPQAAQPKNKQKTKTKK